MEIEPVHPEEISNVRCQAGIVRFDGTLRLLVLRFEGNYREGSRGNPDADVMVGEALKYGSICRPQGIVFDFTPLEYNWGDGLFRVISVDPEPLLPMAPRMVVGGDLSRGGLSSLLPSYTIHSDVDQAVEAAIRASREQRTLDDEYDTSLKMYILVRDSVPAGYAMTGAAHAAVAVTTRYSQSWEIRTWLCGTFRKVVCRVTDAEFEKAKTFPGHVVVTESALKGEEVAMGFVPQREWPKAFQYYRLY